MVTVRRAVEVYAQHTVGAGWSCGSGYLMAGRLVLTAAHVVTPTSTDDPGGAGGARGGVGRVQVRTETGLVEARVVWQRWVDDVDVALVEITDPNWVTSRWRQPLRWGRLVTSQAGQRGEAVGFPAVVAEPQRRDSHHAHGRIHPGGLVKAGLVAMEVDNPPAKPGPGGSGWAGMSGAGLLCQGLLVGVVTVDPRGFDSRRLITVPITKVIDDPEFREIVARHLGRGPVAEAVELVGLAEPVRASGSPAGLLRADVAETPFRDRPELGQLTGWCQGGGWSSTRLVAGPGGQGETRLARYLANQMATLGWATVMLAEPRHPHPDRDSGPGAGPDADRRRLRRSPRPPTRGRDRGVRAGRGAGTAAAAGPYRRGVAHRPGRVLAAAGTAGR